MTKALTIDHLPRIFIKGECLVTNSRDVAKKFEKRHDNVVRDIRSLIDATRTSGHRRDARPSD